MSIFSLITLNNLHVAHSRIHTFNNQRSRLMRQHDFHLTRMLITQVIVYILTTTPYPLNVFYLSITSSMNKSIDRQIIELFIYFISGTYLLFINPSIPFYVYITTSKAFRTESKIALISFWKKIFNKNSNNLDITNISSRSVVKTLAQQQQHQGFQRNLVKTIR